MPSAGEKIGNGPYICLKCGQVVFDDDTNTIPPCPSCDHTEYRKF